MLTTVSLGKIGNALSQDDESVNLAEYLLR